MQSLLKVERNTSPHWLKFITMQGYGTGQKCSLKVSFKNFCISSHIIGFANAAVIASSRNQSIYLLARIPFKELHQTCLLQQTQTDYLSPFTTQTLASFILLLIFISCEGEGQEWYPFYSHEHMLTVLQEVETIQNVYRISTKRKKNHAMKQKLASAEIFVLSQHGFICCQYINKHFKYRVIKVLIQDIKYH